MSNEKCQYCEEPLTSEERQKDFFMRALHAECFARMILGSCAHLQKRCSCFIPGSTEGDPPGMTRRQAARAAVGVIQSRAE